MNKNIQILVAVWCYINLVTPFKHLTLWSAWTVSWSDRTRHGFHPVEQRAVGYVYNSYTTILQSTADKLVALLSVTWLEKNNDAWPPSLELSPTFGWKNLITPLLLMSGIICSDRASTLKEENFSIIYSDCEITLCLLIFKYFTSVFRISYVFWLNSLSPQLIQV